MPDLITIDIYKQAKAIQSEKDDDRLEFIITGVNQLVSTYCGSPFEETDFNRSFNNFYPSTIFLLPYSPILEITSVSERFEITEEFTELIVDEDYVLDKDIDALHRVGGTWPTGLSVINVQGSYGYSSVPSDLMLALVDLVTYYFKEENKVSMSMQGATISNNASSTKSGSIDFPDHIKRVLDLYRQV